jgi:putative transcriptional regulator
MNRIKAIRARLGVTQVVLGEAIGCTQGNIGHYERGQQTFPPDMAAKLIAFAASKGQKVSFDEIYADGSDDAAVEPELHLHAAPARGAERSTAPDEISGAFLALQIQLADLTKAYAGIVRDHGNGTLSRKQVHQAERIAQKSIAAIVSATGSLGGATRGRGGSMDAVRAARHRN